MMIANVGSPVLPGFRVEEAVEIAKTNKKVVLGPGLRQDKDDMVIVCKSGVLRKKHPNTFWVDCYQKRYVPNRGEIVIGIVVQKAGDIFRVDIGASESASLSYMAFEGATKKNRPDVNVGDVICARLLIANRDLEPELICVDSHGKKAKLGVLHEGLVFNCGINLVRKILNPKCAFLDLLAKEMSFEMAAGMNGRIWIKGKTVKQTIALGNAILAVEFKSNDELKDLCDDIGSYVAGFS
ncbi:exosome complex component RRP40 [Toxorhynchites rutilus septentrionalis]|uniref:exosome complex component RRP40 n=1 Tax=Toxorhynchites rutilus septentrionalis TaxID=329112 RepID=UPI00247AEEC7|nr:exosome complex component RRP40 [Toxorhynchites rutilus septentrionalis]